jgi:hypothetical protein
MSANVEHKKKVKAFLLLSVDDDTLALLTDTGKSTAHEVWKQLCDHNEQDSTASKLQSRAQLMSERIRPNEKVNDFITRIIKISEQMKMTGKAPEDDELLYSLLQGISANPPYEVTLRSQDGMTFIKACNLVRDDEIQESVSAASQSDRAYYVRNVREDRQEIVCKYCK